MSFLGIPKNERRDGYASRPRLRVVPPKVRPPRQSGMAKYEGCDMVSFVLGCFMLLGGFAVLIILLFPSIITDNLLQPFLAVPAAIMVAGIIFIVIATVSAKRKAWRLNEISGAAARQAQLGIQSVTTTTNTGSYRQIPEALVSEAVRITTEQISYVALGLRSRSRSLQFRCSVIQPWVVHRRSTWCNAQTTCLQATKQ